MTDYRLRNHDLLYAKRDPQPLTWDKVAVFGAILATVTIGVVGHLTDRFTPTAAMLSPPGAAAQQAGTPQPAMQLATPSISPSGS